MAFGMDKNVLFKIILIFVLIFNSLLLCFNLVYFPKPQDEPDILGLILNFVNYGQIPL
jgi:hypothetical protein